MLATPRGPVCVDLFAGCGGLTEGLLSAGVDVVASVELHPQAALSHAFNHPSTSVFVGDVRKWNYALLDDELQSRGHDRIDIVVGGPPCQGFSSAGKKFSRTLATRCFARTPTLLPTTARGCSCWKMFLASGACSAGRRFATRYRRSMLSAMRPWTTSCVRQTSEFLKRGNGSYWPGGSLKRLSRSNYKEWSGDS